MRITNVLGAVLCAGLMIPTIDAADGGMKAGKVTLKSAGPIAFAPEGVLLVADTKAAAVFAIETGDKGGNGATKPLKVQGINEKVAALLGTSADQVLIN